MTLEEVKEHFVTYRNAMRKIQASERCYINWRRWGYIPYYQQVRLERASEGKLKADIGAKEDAANRYRELQKRT